MNERIYHTVNNGVYKAGFATTQVAYEEAVVPLFETLDWIDDLLATRRYLTGAQVAKPTGGSSPPLCASTQSMSGTSSATCAG